jgi:hypothetical protein
MSLFPDMEGHNGRHYIARHTLTLKGSFVSPSLEHSRHHNLIISLASSLACFRDLSRSSRGMEYPSNEFFKGRNSGPGVSEDGPTSSAPTASSTPTPRCPLSCGRPRCRRDTWVEVEQNRHFSVGFSAQNLTLREANAKAFTGLVVFLDGLNSWSSTVAC